MVSYRSILRKVLIDPKEACRQASINGLTEIVRYLLDFGVGLFQRFGGRLSNDQMFIGSILQNGHREIFKLLLKRQIEPNFEEFLYFDREHAWCNALQIASEKGYLDVVTLMLDINQEYTEHAIASAAKGNRSKLIRFILENYSDGSHYIRDTERLSFPFEDISLMNDILDFGLKLAQINLNKEEFERTFQIVITQALSNLLQFHGDEDFEETALVLINRGADLEYNKRSILLSAAHDGNLNVFKFLSDHEVDVCDEQALSKARIRNYLHVVKFLENISN